MTAEIERLAEMEKAATKRPWKWEAHDASMVTLFSGDDMLAGPHVLSSVRCSACQERMDNTEPDRYLCGWPNGADSDLIVALRNQAPALISKARNFDRAVAMLKEARYSPQEGKDKPESRFLLRDQPEWIGDRVFLTKDLCDRIAALLAEAESGYNGEDRE